MSQVKVSELPAASGLNTADVVIVNQSGVTKRTTGGAFTDTMTGFLQSGTGAVARTPQAKGRDVISVKDFGATGDGTTNDAATVQSALNAASGKALYFPTGTYLINTTLDIPTNVLILGDGYGSEIKAGANPVAQAISRSNVSMRGLRFTSNGSVSFTITFRLCTNVRVEGCIINHLVGAALGTQAMRFQGTIGASVVNSQFYDSSEAHIYLDSWPVAGAGTHSDLIDVVGCYFENTIVGNYATPAAIYQYYCKRLTVDDCTFKDIRPGGGSATLSYSVYEGDGAADSLSVTNCTTVITAALGHVMVQNSNAPACLVDQNRFFGTALGAAAANVNRLYSGGPTRGDVRITNNYSSQGSVICGGGATAATGVRSLFVHDNFFGKLEQNTAAIQVGVNATNYVEYASIKNNVSYGTYAAGVYIGECVFFTIEDNRVMNWNTQNNATATNYAYTAAIYAEPTTKAGVIRRNRIENNSAVGGDVGYPQYAIVADAAGAIDTSGNNIIGTMTGGNYVNITPNDSPIYLTSIAGTNTITAAGPIKLASLVAGQIFNFTPANTNTGATTLNITPSGRSALGATNVYFNGAACAGGEIRQNQPCVIIYDGTQFNLIGPFAGGTVAGNTTFSGTLAVTGTAAFNATTSASLASRASIRIQERTVVTSATTIISLGQVGVAASGALVTVSGYETAATTITFTDVVLCLSTGGSPTVIAAQGLNTPQARTYTMSGSNLQLAMAASTSYTVSVTSLQQSN